MKSYHDKEIELLTSRQQFRLTYDILMQAQITEQAAKEARRRAETAYAELKVRIEILEDEMDLPEANRTFKGRYDDDIEEIVDFTVGDNI